MKKGEKMSDEQKINKNNALVNVERDEEIVNMYYQRSGTVIA